MSIFKNLSTYFASKLHLQQVIATEVKQLGYLQTLLQRSNKLYNSYKREFFYQKELAEIWEANATNYKVDIERLNRAIGKAETKLFDIKAVKTAYETILLNIIAGLGGEEVVFDKTQEHTVTWGKGDNEKEAIYTYDVAQISHVDGKDVHLEANHLGNTNCEIEVESVWFELSELIKLSNLNEVLQEKIRGE